MYGARLVGTSILLWRLFPLCRLFRVFAARFHCGVALSFQGTLACVTTVLLHWADMLWIMV